MGNQVQHFSLSHVPFEARWTYSKKRSCRRSFGVGLPSDHSCDGFLRQGLDDVPGLKACHVLETGSLDLQKLVSALQAALLSYTA